MYFLVAQFGFQKKKTWYNINHIKWGRVRSVSWHIRHLSICPLLLTTSWAIIHEQKSLCEVLGSSTVCQGTRRIPRQRVIGTQASVQTIKPAGAIELTPILLGHSEEKPEDCYLGQKPIYKRNFVEVQFSRWKIAALHWTKNNNVSLDALEVLKGSLPVGAFPPGNIAW